MGAPLIDGRSAERIIEQIVELAPYYVPEWSAMKDRDAASAVLQIFAQFYVDTLQRLNRVPEKNFITFLNKLGVSLLPAMQSSAPVTFRLSAGAKEAVLIPGRTQVAAPLSDGGKPVVFETVQPILATPARITELVCVADGGESLYSAPPGFAEQPAAPFWAVLASSARLGETVLSIDNAKGLQTGELLAVGGSEVVEVLRVKENTVLLSSPLKDSYAAGTEINRVTVFPLFTGLNKQENLLYLAHHDLFRCGAGSIITLRNEEAGPSGESGGTILDTIKWQYWDEAWIDFMPAGEGSIAVPPDTKQIGLCGVNGKVNCWIRGIIPSPPGDDYSSMRLGAWQLTAMNGMLKPDMLFSNDNPVIPEDFSGTGFYLFGPQPRIYDSLYIASGEALSKRGASVTLTFHIGETDAVNIADIFTSGVSWEYWNGGGWMRWNMKKKEYDEAANIFRICFQNASDVSPVAVQGQESYWIRCRLIASDPGEQSSGTLEVPGKRLPLTGLSLFYMVEAAPEQVLTYRQLHYRDHSDGQLFELWESDDRKQALYMGFDSAPLKGPISIYFSLQDQSYEADNHPILEWEYFAEQRGGSDWVKLDVNDGTNHLTRSGSVEFIGLPDWTESLRFGKSRFWLRAVDKLNLFRGGEARSRTVPAAQGPTAPAPVIRGIYRNTTAVYQAESFRDEVVGSSRGMPEAAFTVSKVPIIAEELFIDEISSISDRERLSIKAGGLDLFIEEKDDKGNLVHFWVKWMPAEQLMDSGPNDRHYAVDRTFGTIRFGDGIHGMVPPIGTNNIKLHYRAGGGSRGNVGASAISMLKSSIAYVDGVINPEAASGGYDTEETGAAMKRGPLMIRHRYRAVTADDYENLVIEAARGIAKVKCLPNVNDQGQPQSGWITLLIVPQSAERLPQPSAGLKQMISSYVLERAANVIAFRSHINVRGPAYAEISVQAVITALSMDRVPDVERESLRRLKQFLHPLTGGTDNNGWEFGRIPALSDMYALLADIPGLDYIDKLEITVRDPDNGVEAVIDASGSASVSFSQDLLVYSGTHRVTVKGKPTIRI